MRLIFSKDRPAQLDLLLRSLERNAGPEPTAILYRASSRLYADGYQRVWADHRPWRYVLLPEFLGNFENLVRREIELTEDELVTFFCDDDVLFAPAGVPALDRDVLCFSLRYGENTVRQYPSDMPQMVELEPVTRYGDETPLVGTWHWHGAEGDFGYPGSLDGHVFRTEDVRRMLDGKRFSNPTALECALVDGCFALREELPLMACYPHSVLVGLPVNRVSEQSGVRFGVEHPATAWDLNERFLLGDRLDLDGIDFSAVNAAHTELPLVWQERVTV